MKKFTFTMPGVWLTAILSLFFFTACSESDTDGDTDDKPETESSTGSDGTGAETGSGGSTSPLYLVTQINVVNKWVTVGGYSGSYEDIWYFEYDDAGRVTSMYTNDSEDGTVSITYEDGKIVMVDENEGYREETTCTLGEDGYVTSYTSVEGNSYSQYTYTGTLTYSDGYVVKCIHQSGLGKTSIETAVWESGNLVKVSYPSDTDNSVSEMSYDNPEYVNNTNINMDLNYVVCSTEWMACMMLNNSYLQPFGYIGKRSALYMTEEYDRYNDCRYTYTYQFDGLGRPVTIKATCSGDSYYVSDEYTYTIIYNK